MNALARITLLTRTVNIAPRAIIATSSMGSTRMFGLGSDLASKVCSLSLFLIVV